LQSPSSFDPLLRSEAAEVLLALLSYEQTGIRLVQTWLDMEVYSEFSRQIDAIRTRGPSVPSLTVPLLHLVIAHSELVCTLWQNASVGGGAARLKEVEERHAQAIEALRASIARMLRND